MGDGSDKTPSRDQTDTGAGKGTAGMPHCAAVEVSKKLPSTPESTSAEQELQEPSNLIVTGNRVQDEGEFTQKHPPGSPGLLMGLGF